MLTRPILKILKNGIGRDPVLQKPMLRQASHLNAGASRFRNERSGVIHCRAQSIRRWLHLDGGYSKFLQFL
jgi:hypothetical protein